MSFAVGREAMNIFKSKKYYLNVGVRHVAFSEKIVT